MANAEGARLIKIVDGTPKIINDEWKVVLDAEDWTSASAAQRFLVPLAQWRRTGGRRSAGLWINPDEDFEADMSFLAQVEVVAVHIASFRDGRGLSVSHLLRTRYAWRGELRAIGDVLRDQLRQMRRCGFDAFAIRHDKDIEDALKGLTPRPIHYQGAADDPTPLFRRRDAGLSRR